VNVALVISVFAIMCLITFLLFISGQKLSARVNPGILKVVTRVMGLILAVIAIQMVITGIEGTIHLFK
jgi:multiple antibiotic resistance protein